MSTNFDILALHSGKGKGMDGLGLVCLFPSLDTALVGSAPSLTGTWAWSACKIVLVFHPKDTLYWPGLV